MSARLLAGGEPAALAAAVFEELGPGVGADLFFHFRHEPGADAPLTLAACAGVSDEVRATFATLRFGDDVCGRTAASRQWIHHPRVQQSDDPALDRLRPAGIRAYLCMPLVVGDRLLGTMSFGTRRQDAFEPDALDVLRAASLQLATALDRHATEHALRASEESLRLALEASDTGLWSWDMHRDAVWWSPECFRLHGVDPDVFAGTAAAFFELVHPADRDRISRTVSEAMATGSRYESELRIVRPSGEVVWVSDRARASYDASGRPTGMRGTTTDISARKRAEEALRESESFHRQMLESIPGMVFTSTPDGACDYVSEPCVELTGVSAAELLGEGWLDVLHPDDRERTRATWSAALAAQAPSDIEYRVRRRDGAYEWFKVRARPIRDASGAIVRWFGAALNVDDLKQAQAAIASRERELRHANERKDVFLATLAHELRNPLAPIRAGLHVLQRAPDADPTTARVLETMERQLGHMVRLVDDLLDVSRIGHGKIRVERRRIALQAAVQHALEAAQPVVEAGGHSMHVELPDAPVHVDGDLTRLAQVVGNLLDNAAKYTPHGGHIDVSLAVEGDHAVVRVRDDGAGIAPDVLPRVFELFAQADGARDHARGGIGIGLSLVRSLVELHGGSVEAQSAGLARGSSFVVRLPRAPSRAAPSVDEPAATTDHDAAPRRVLVVDDHVDGAELVGMLLAGLGHVVSTVHSGPEALDAVRTFRPEIVLLDLGLPEMDGFEVAERLRAEPASPPLVLVAVTGWGSDDDKRDARDAGFDVHLTKPVEPAALLEVLARVPEFAAERAR